MTWPAGLGESVLLDECEMLHNAYMKNGSITIRIPKSLKQRLEARAKSRRRSLSAQVTADLESFVEASTRDHHAAGKFLGLFEGTRVPSDDDIKKVRSLLWFGGDRLVLSRLSRNL